MTKTKQLVGPFTELLTMGNIPLRGAINDDTIQIISHAGIVIEDNKIVSIGHFDKMYNTYKAKNLHVEELEEKSVGLPGFIDVHTHICYGGSRARDYAMRNGGKTYLDIAKAGGGIWQTVNDTRKESQEALVNGILRRLEKVKQNGITTIEIKSGYGLSIVEELKMLRAIKASSVASKLDIVATCLAAHIFPKDYDGTISEYLYEISQKLFPILRDEKLSTRIDAFVEEEAFSGELIAPYFSRAQELGFDICIHADQFSTGASKVAVDFKAVSADHLEASTEKEIILLANSDVVPVALPGASIGLGCPFTPARKLLDAGTSLAIASDWNPGSAPMGDLLTQASILATFEKLSNAEVLAALTCRAAPVLRLKDRGVLAPHMLADFTAFPTNDYREIFYHQGQMKPSHVWKKAELILSS